MTKYASAASDASVSLTISGSVATNSTSQFKVLTVTSATGSGAPTVGDTSYALEIPGTAMFFKPFGSAAEPIILVSGTTCPSSNFNANWIVAKPRSDLAVPMTTTSDVFGGVAVTVNGASSSLNGTTYEPIAGASLGSGNDFTLSFNATTCANGVQRVADGADFFDMYFTDSGNILVRFSANSGNQIIFGSPRQSAAVTQASIAGTYSAIVFADESGSDNMFPAQLTIPTSGTSEGYSISDLTNNTVSTDGIALTGIASTTDSSATELPAGMFRGSVNPVSGTATNGKVTCSYSTSGSTKVLACFGFFEDTGSNARRPFFILGRSR